MRKLDKKQQCMVVLLGILAAGLFGTFIFQMLKITPAAAHTQVAGASGQQTTTTTAKAAPGAKTVALNSATNAATSPEAPPPTSTMRDPFIPGVADPAALEAYQKSLESAKHSGAPQKSGAWNKPTVPFVARLPHPNSGFSAPAGRTADFKVAPLPTPGPDAPALPEAPAAPAWTMTGVVESDGGQMAILRNGDQRRMVRRGDMLDSNFRVVEVGRGRVMVAHGNEKYLLPLGGSRTAPGSAPSTSTSTAPAPQPNTPQELGAPSAPVTGLPSGTQVSPNAVIKLPGGLSLPAVHLPAN